MSIEIQSAEQKAKEQAPTQPCRDCGQVVEIVRTPDGTYRFGRHDWQEGQTCWGWFAQVDAQDAWAHSLESRFTPPRGECDHPERWHSTDADSTEWEVTGLVAAFVKALRPDIVVETGTAWGQTAHAIGEKLAERDPDQSYDPKLYTLEVDPARVAYSRRRCEGLPVEVIEMSSLDWEPPGPIGFAWFDSLHQLRVPEFRKFHKHFAPGAFVGFHDTGIHQGDLRRQIAGLEGEGLLFPMHLPTPRGVTFGEVGWP